MLAHTVAGALPAREVRDLAVGLAAGLVAIHAAGVVHRDVKPSNVLLSAEGPKVIDFGIAQTTDATGLTSIGMAIGSPGYMAPEQLTGDACTASDVFAWGLTVVFAATGRPPFGTGPAAAIAYRIGHTTPDVAGVPASLRPIVSAALAVDPQQRPTAGELVARLPFDRRRRTVLMARPAADRPAEAARTRLWPSTRQLPAATSDKGQSRAVAWILAAAVAVIAAAGAAALLHPGRAETAISQPVADVDSRGVEADAMSAAAEQSLAVLGKAADLAALTGTRLSFQGQDFLTTLSLAANLGPPLSRQLGRPVAVHCGAPGQLYVVGGPGTTFTCSADAVADPNTTATYRITVTDHHGAVRYVRIG